MTEPEIKYQLILKQQAIDPSELQALLQVLRDDYGLDMYTAKHRLIGPGLVQFGKGGMEKATALAALLRQHGFECWKIQRSPIAFPPVRLRSLELHDDRITFQCSHNKTIHLNRGQQVVAVLADVSGQLPDRHVRRHMVQKNYRGVEQMVGMDLEELCQTVLKGDPVFDIFPLDPQGRPEAMVRVYAGRFNPDGLGDDKTLSAVRNLDAMRHLVEDYAGEFALHADFGLSRLPGCEVKTLDGQLEERDLVLQNLIRYGWLMCDLVQDRSVAEPSAPQEGVNPALLAAALATGQPALASAVASGNLDAMPGLKEVSEEVAVAMAETHEDGTKVPTADPGLPPPPELMGRRKYSLRMILSQLGFFLIVGIMIALTASDGRWLRSLNIGTREEMVFGIFAGVLSLMLFLGGFHFIRLKRRIENTPTSRIRSIAMGLVEVHGRARRKYALVSPMGQSACIYYRLRKYKRERNDKWRLVSDRDSSHVPFLVDDGTGSVTVDPMGALVRAKSRRTGTPGEMTLAFSGVSTVDSDEKWVEEVIYEDTSLYVIGYARPQRKQEQSLGERVREKLRDLKLDPKALHRYDTDGDGRISEAEWDAARSAAEQQALSDHLAIKQGRVRQEEHAVITRPHQRGLPFVISETLSEADLTRKYGMLSLPMLIVGLAAAGFAIYEMLLFLGN